MFFAKWQITHKNGFIIATVYISTGVICPLTEYPSFGGLGYEAHTIQALLWEESVFHLELHILFIIILFGTTFFSMFFSRTVLNLFAITFCLGFGQFLHIGDELLIFVFPFFLDVLCLFCLTFGMAKISFRDAVGGVLFITSDIQDHYGRFDVLVSLITEVFSLNTSGWTISEFRSLTSSLVTWLDVIPESTIWISVFIDGRISSSVKTVLFGGQIPLLLNLVEVLCVVHAWINATPNKVEIWNKVTIIIPGLDLIHVWTSSS